MKKFRAALTTFLIFVLVLSGCSGSGKPDVNMNIADVANDMLGAAGTEAELVKAGDKIIEKYYDLSLAEEYIVYQEATGAFAEEVAIFKAKTDEDVAKIKALFETRTSDQRTRYESYVPSEVFKINNAVITVNGRYVAYVVSAQPDKAVEIFTKAGQ